MLFLPADSEKKIAKGADSGADGLILDLEDSVASGRKAIGRKLARSYLDAHPVGARRQPLLVRVNPLQSGMALVDLAAVAGGAPDYVILPKYRTADDVRALDHYLSALEVREGVPSGHIRIFVLATETAEGVFNLAGLAGSSPRLSHVAWAEFDLGAAVGAQDQFLDDGAWDDLYRTARGLGLAAAVAARAEPCNTVYIDYKNPDGLSAMARAARRAGFTCMMAIHPNQVATINEAFSVTESELEWSRRVVEAFAADPEAGVIGLDGIMLDLPHLNQAKRTLARAAAERGRG